MTPYEILSWLEFIRVLSTSRSPGRVPFVRGGGAGVGGKPDRKAWGRGEPGDAYAELGLVFATRLGTALLAPEVSRKFKRALARAGLRPDIRFHDLRHGAITMMLSQGKIGRASCRERV